jgi:hypothetical protein
MSMRKKNNHCVIVGLAGRKRVGKDSVANILINKYGYRNDSFANPIRKFIALLTNSVNADETYQLDADKEEPIEWLGGISKRYMMQTLGTEWGRDLVHPEIWINALWRRVDVKNASVPLVISDIRYEDEAQSVREKGGWVVHVCRPGLPQTDMHETESNLYIKKTDGIVYNDGDISALRSTVINGLMPAIEKLFGVHK